MKDAKLDKEFKNTFIKCKYTGCKESVNLYDYEKHLKVCAFKDIKDSIQLDNLVYFNTLPIKEDPYSNSILMNYSVKNAENDIEINNKTSLVENNEIVEKRYEDWTQDKYEGNDEVFKNILENAKKFEDEILEEENKKKEVNELIKEMQSKIALHEMA